MRFEFSQCCSFEYLGRTPCTVDISESARGNPQKHLRGGGRGVDRINDIGGGIREDNQVLRNSPLFSFYHILVWSKIDVTICYVLANVVPSNSALYLSRELVSFLLVQKVIVNLCFAILDEPIFLSNSHTLFAQLRSAHGLNFPVECLLLT